MREMPPEPLESEILVLLAKRRRRLLLRVLQESSTPLTPRELADRIGKREHENPTDTDRRTIHLSLHHNHLPRLEEAGVIVYDGTVTPGLNFDSFIHVLGEVTERERPWSDV